MTDEPNIGSQAGLSTPKPDRAPEPDPTPNPEDDWWWNRGLSGSERRILSKLAGIVVATLAVLSALGGLGLNSCVNEKVDDLIDKRIEAIDKRIESTLDLARQKLVQLEDSQAKLTASLTASQSTLKHTEEALASLTEQRDKAATQASEVSKLLGQTSVVLALKKLKYDLHRIKTLRLVSTVRSPLASDPRFRQVAIFDFYLKDDQGQWLAEFQPIPDQIVSEHLGPMPALRFEHRLYPMYDDVIIGAQISTLAKASTMVIASLPFNEPPVGPPLADPQRDMINQFWSSITRVGLRLLINDVPISFLGNVESAPITMRKVEQGKVILRRALQMPVPAGFRHIAAQYEEAISKDSELQ
jgi:hypothetical protein